MIKLLIVDDDMLIRESLKLILNTFDDIQVVGTSANGKECIDFLIKEEVDLVLLDLRMPIMDGIEVLKYTKEHLRKDALKVLVLTTFDEDDLINSAIYYGASGYILKNSTPDNIVHALRAVAAGNSVFHNEIVKRMGEKNVVTHSTSWKNYGLSGREMELVEQIAEGLSNKEIAEKLFISEGTVKNYITSILTKMNLKHRTQIAIAYLKR